MTDQHPAQSFRDRLRTDPAPARAGGTPAHACVLLALANYADHDGIAYPGLAELSTVTGHHPDTIRRALSWAHSAGYIDRAGGGHRGRATAWRLIATPKATAPRRLSGVPLIDRLERARAERQKGGASDPTNAGRKVGPLVAKGGASDPTQLEELDAHARTRARETPAPRNPKQQETPMPTPPLTADAPRKALS